MENLNSKKHNKTIYAVTVTLFALIPVLFLTLNSKLSASSEDAKILFSEKYHDFGKVEQGQVLEYLFNFTN